MRLSNILDVRQRHVRRWMEDQGAQPECVELTQCYGFFGNEVNFYNAPDSFELTEEVMKGWGYKGRVAKHMKLTFSDSQCRDLLDHFASRPHANDAFIEAVEGKEAEKERVIAEIQEEPGDDSVEDAEDW